MRDWKKILASAIENIEEAQDSCPDDVYNELNDIISKLYILTEE